MSFGFYRLPHGTSHEDYLVRTAKAHGVVIAVGYEVIDESPPAITPEVFESLVLEPPKVQDTLLHDVRAQGYSGDICSNCQGSRLRWAGHCQVCEDCGTSTGCS